MNWTGACLHTSVTQRIILQCISPLHSTSNSKVQIPKSKFQREEKAEIVPSLAIYIYLSIYPSLPKLAENPPSRVDGKIHGRSGMGRGNMRSDLGNVDQKR